MYGRVYSPIAAAQIDTPEVNVNEFIDPATLTLWGKFPDGSVKPLCGTGFGGLLNPDAADAGTNGNTLVFNVSGVAAYNAGDTYVFMLTQTNTGAVTININGLGVKNVYYKGNILAPIEASKFQAYTAHVFIYVGGAFQWIGQVDGNMVRYEARVSYAEAAVIGGVGATANLDLLNVPPKSVPVAAVIYPTVATAAAGLAAATLQTTNIESALDLFGGTVDAMAVPATDKGGISSGLNSNTDIPYQAGVQQYRTAWVLAGDTWDNVSAGSFTLSFVWMPISA